MEGSNHTKSDGVQNLSLGLAYAIEPKERVEQERTRVGKKLFLENFIASRGIIALVGEKIGITRETYYAWRKSDPKFLADIEALRDTTNLAVEDELMKKVFVDHDGSSIRYYLDRNEPRYMPKSKVEVTPVGDEHITVEIVKREKNGDIIKTGAGDKDAGDGSVPTQPAGDEKDRAEPGRDPVK